MYLHAFGLLPVLAISRYSIQIDCVDYSLSHHCPESPSKGSSPKHTEKERPKEKVPDHAIAKRPFKTSNLDFLSFQKGDVVVDLLYTKKDKTWVGTKRNSQERGYFSEDYFNFSEEYVDPIAVNESNTSQHSFGCPESEIVQTSQGFQTTRNSKHFQQSDENGKRSTKSICIMTIVALFFAIVAAYTIASNATYQRRSAKITELISTFKSQDPNMWETLRAGLMTSKTERVKTFLFLHSSNGPTVECLIEKLSDNACVVREASEIYNNDDFVTKLKINLEKHKCMVINNLERLHPEGVVVLKGLCDAYYPTVPNSEFYFALNAGQRGLLEENLSKAARVILESTWSQQLSRDDFGGTVTRLTQNVLKVSKEEKLPCGTR